MANKNARIVLYQPPPYPRCERLAFRSWRQLLIPRHRKFWIEHKLGPWVRSWVKFRWKKKKLERRDQKEICTWQIFLFVIVWIISQLLCTPLILDAKCPLEQKLMQDPQFPYHKLQGKKKRQEKGERKKKYMTKKSWHTKPDQGQTKIV